MEMSTRHFNQHIICCHCLCMGSSPYHSWQTVESVHTLAYSWVFTYEITPKSHVWCVWSKQHDWTQTHIHKQTHTDLTNKCDLVAATVGQLIYSHHSRCWFQPTDRFHSCWQTKALRLWMDTSLIQYCCWLSSDAVVVKTRLWEPIPSSITTPCFHLFSSHETKCVGL